MVETEARVVLAKRKAESVGGRRCIVVVLLAFKI